MKKLRRICCFALAFAVLFSLFVNVQASRSDVEAKEDGTNKYNVYLSGATQNASTPITVLLKEGNDITYVNQYHSDDDGSYTISFKYAGDITKAKFLICDSNTTEDITDTIKVAQAQSDLFTVDIGSIEEYENGVKVSFKYDNKSLENVDYNVILAAYAKNGALVKCEFKNLNAAFKSSNDNTVVFNDFPKSDSVAKYKAYAWNIVNLVPYGKSARLVKDGVTVHLISDSLCCDYEKLGFNPTHAPQTGWGQVIGDYFNDDIIIDNQARAGWSTNGFLLASNQNYNHDMYILNNPENSRWKKAILPTIKSGDYVIISLAINDKYVDSFDYYYEDSVNGEYNKDENGNYVKVEKGTGKYSFYTWISTPEKYKENLKIFIDDTLRAGATPILLGSTSSCSSSGGYGDISQYIDGMRAVAKEKNITYLDGYGTYKKYIEDNGGYDKVAYMNHFTPENIAEFRKSGITVGTKWNTTTSDKTHYNSNGAKYVAKMIIDLLKESDSNLKNYIR